MSIVTLNDRGVRSVTTFGSLNTGSMVFIKKLTASSSSTLSFVNGSSDVVLDSTYKEYVFTFNNIHPSAYASLQFQTSTNGGSSYGVTVTSTVIQTTHDESGSSSSLAYETGLDLAQSTNFQTLSRDSGNDNDQCCSGTLHLFDPSNSTFVKHFMATFNTTTQDNQQHNSYASGYVNTTTALTRVRFKFHSGNIDSGTIKMYGVV